MENAIGATIASATVRPEKFLAVLSSAEVAELCAAQNKTIYALFRRCALAVLTSGIESDDADELSTLYADFDVHFESSARGIVVHLVHAPAAAFVDGEIIAGAREHLFAVLRDIIYVARDLADVNYDREDSNTLTEIVFRILRQAELLASGRRAGLVVCWGGHAIASSEYDYTKEVGYQIGLRGLDVCTGCGPGAMKGPMKGATIAHAKQRIRRGRYIGLTEPGIIAAEAPNAIVNHLCILPDIEKRLEAFVRLGHGIVVFPGGVGTLEEILYILGILMHPKNTSLPFPLIFSGPSGSEKYFATLNDFIASTLGTAATSLYEVIVNDAPAVAAKMSSAIEQVQRHRESVDDAPNFNWSLTIEPRFQRPFDVTHESMAALALHRALPPHELAGNLRQAFSGVVAGNVKADGIRAVAAHGPFELHAEPAIAQGLDALLRSFIDEQRMRLPGQEYVPSYRVVG